jgi:hypothetical protein
MTASWVYVESGLWSCAMISETSRTEGVSLDLTHRRSALQAYARSNETGQRAWLAARQEAGQRSGFDLKRWHTTAVGLGPIGLGGLTEALKRVG